MEKSQAYIRIQELREIINDANRKYYVENSPVLSDYEFDMLLKELEVLENEHPYLMTSDSPTQRVGSDISAGSAMVSGKEFEHSLVKLHTLTERSCLEHLESGLIIRLLQFH